MPITDSKERFSNRVADYIRYRPGYPPAIIDVFRYDCALTPDSVVADVGSGTGILTKLLLGNGNVVYGVEPNAEMREAGENFLQQYSRFKSVEGSAEATTLPTASVDLIVAGQAFHWFDRSAARREFARILKPGGWVALIWNEREVTATPFMSEYEQLIERHGTDYSAVHHKYSEQAGIDEFFAPSKVAMREFENQQHIDFDGLKGRLMSASYAPPTGDPRHEPMIRDLLALFTRHQSDGRVTILYRTRIYFARL
jgi:SAM-dependent methyltransferase